MLKKFKTSIPKSSFNIEKELINWVEALSEALVLKALKIARERNIQNMSYVRAILQDWKAKGHKTLTDVEQTEKWKSNPKRELREWEPPDYGKIPTDEELKRFLEEEGGSRNRMQGAA